MKRRKIYDKGEDIIIAKNIKELKQGIEEALPDVLKRINKIFNKDKK